MCFFGGGGSSSKVADPPPPEAAPPPQPVPVPSDVSPQNTADQNRQKIQNLKYGAASTIKTSPQGITGAGPDLAPSQAGGMYGGDFATKRTTGS